MSHYCYLRQRACLLSKTQLYTSYICSWIWMVISTTVVHDPGVCVAGTFPFRMCLIYSCSHILYYAIFIRPSSDGTYYGMVMSVRPSVRPGLRPSVCPSQFSALFSYMLRHIDLKFCVSFYFYARKIKFECHPFSSLFAGVMLLFNFKLLQICSFPHFSPTCFDILSSNFVYDFVLMYHRASLSVVILLQFLLELCLFVNLEYSKYTVFRTFLLYALTYWAEILHITLFYCTTDQVRVSSICVKFCGSYAPFGT